jgi:hypothetical protein
MQLQGKEMIASKKIMAAFSAATLAVFAAMPASATSAAKALCRKASCSR